MRAGDHEQRWEQHGTDNIEPDKEEGTPQNVSLEDRADVPLVQPEHHHVHVLGRMGRVGVPRDIGDGDGIWLATQHAVKVLAEDIIIDDPSFSHHLHQGKRLQDFIDVQCAISYGLATAATKSKVLTEIRGMLQKQATNPTTRFLVSATTRYSNLPHEGHHYYRLASEEEIMKAIQLAVKMHFKVEPGNRDVLFGKGIRTTEHEGNNLYRQFIHANLDRYQQVRKKTEEREQIYRETIKYMNGKGGRFLLPFDPGRPSNEGCIVAPHKAVMNKVAHRYRDAIREQRKLEKQRPHSDPPQSKGAAVCAIDRTMTAGNDHLAGNLNQQGNSVSQMTISQGWVNQEPDEMEVEAGTQNYERKTMMEHSNDDGNLSRDCIFHNRVSALQDVDLPFLDLESPEYWNLGPPAGYNQCEGEQKVEGRSTITPNPDLQECADYAENQNHHGIDGCLLAPEEAIIKHIEQERYPHSISAWCEVDDASWDVDLGENQNGQNGEDMSLPSLEREESVDGMEEDDYLEQRSKRSNSTLCHDDDSSFEIGQSGDLFEDLNKYIMEQLSHSSGRCEVDGASPRRRSSSSAGKRSCDWSSRGSISASGSGSRFASIGDGTIDDTRCSIWSDGDDQDGEDSRTSSTGDEECEEDLEECVEYGSSSGCSSVPSYRSIKDGSIDDRSIDGSSSSGSDWDPYSDIQQAGTGEEDRMEIQDDERSAYPVVESNPIPARVPVASTVVLHQFWGTRIIKHLKRLFCCGNSCWIRRWNNCARHNQQTFPSTQ